MKRYKKEAAVRAYQKHTEHVWLPRMLNFKWRPSGQGNIWHHYVRANVHLQEYQRTTDELRVDKSWAAVSIANSAIDTLRMIVLIGVPAALPPQKKIAGAYVTWKVSNLLVFGSYRSRCWRTIGLVCGKNWAWNPARSYYVATSFGVWAYY